MLGKWEKNKQDMGVQAQPNKQSVNNRADGKK